MRRAWPLPLPLAGSHYSGRRCHGKKRKKSKCGKRECMPEWENWTVALDAIHDLNEVVVSEGRYRGFYKPTGKTMDVQVCHVWTFRDGKIASFHQYLDSARLQDIMGRR